MPTAGDALRIASRRSSRASQSHSSACFQHGNFAQNRVAWFRTLCEPVADGFGDRAALDDLRPEQLSTQRVQFATIVVSVNVNGRRCPGAQTKSIQRAEPHERVVVIAQERSQLLLPIARGLSREDAVGSQAFRTGSCCSL